MKTKLDFRNGRTLYQVFLHSILIALAIEVLLLTRQNRNLSESAKNGYANITVGQHFSFDGLEPSQGISSIESTTTQLVYVFSTHCGACKMNRQSINHVFQEARSDSITAIAISIDANDTSVTFPLGNGLQSKVSTFYGGLDFSRLNHINIVPLTIIRSSNGVVKKSITGVLDVKDIQDIAEAMSLNKSRTN